MKQNGALRELWIPVAMSAIVVAGSLATAGAYFESLRPKPAPPKPLPITNENKTWERIHLPQNDNKAPTKPIEVMTLSTPEEVGKTVVQAHQLEQFLSRREVHDKDVANIQTSIVMATRYLQSTGAQCGLLMSAYTPDAGNAAQGSYVGLRLQFNPYSGETFISNLRPILPDRDVMVRYHEMPEELIAARERLMVKRQPHSYHYWSSNNPALCRDVMGLPALPAIS